jgi:NAD(P)-dependent dehydrogenase (short-subunit alcohol dehydrogenase family)
MGVVHGIRAFLPHIRGHGEGGHIVNTASMAGLVAGIGLSPYAASKFAVVGISEGLAMQLRSDNIGVTVVCPRFVRTRIGESGRNRQQCFGQARVLDPSSGNAAVMAEIRRLIEAGIDPEKVAARVLSAVQENELYVFTHPEERQELDDRFAAIRQAMDKSLR